MQIKAKLKSLARAVLVASIVVAAVPVNAGMHAPLRVNPADIIIRDPLTPPARLCETLLPMLQPRLQGPSATEKATYWVFSINFQSLANTPQGIGVGGCITTIGRDPNDRNAPYHYLREDYVLCLFSTKNIAGSGWTNEDFGGRGVVTYGAADLPAKDFGGTATSMWQPVTFSGGAFVYCPDVDLKGNLDYNFPALPNSGVPATLDQVSRLKYFSMAVFGKGLNPPVINNNSTSPLITYVPNAAACAAYQQGGCSATSLSAPYWHGESLWRLRSSFNGITTSVTTQNSSSQELQYLHTEFVNETNTRTATVTQTRYTAAGLLTPSATYQVPTTITTPDKGYFRFWTGKSTIIIGRTSLAATGDTFEGTLYEIIVDPSGDSKPGGI